MVKYRSKTCFGEISLLLPRIYSSRSRRKSSATAMSNWNRPSRTRQPSAITKVKGLTLRERGQATRSWRYDQLTFANATTSSRTRWTKYGASDNSYDSKLRQKLNLERTLEIRTDPVNTNQICTPTKFDVPDSMEPSKFEFEVSLTRNPIRRQETN